MATGNKYSVQPAPYDYKEVGRYVEEELRRVQDAMDFLWKDTQPVLAYSTTTAGNSGTTETDLYSFSVPANTLRKNGESVDFWFGGSLLEHATATRQLRVKFGATTIYDSTAQTNTTNYEFSLRGMIIRVSNTSQKCITFLNSTQAQLFTFTDYSTAAETLSSAIILKLTGQAGGVGAATDDIKFEMGKIFWSTAP